MEALLPSEIARLVFGYLEDEKCDEAARSFLEASPLLQECRTAVSSGRRFNTRVNGYTLVDIFDKFFAAHSLVQERLSKVGDCEQVRQCGDLLEQLRFLIGGSRGQRFVVNINVPSQANSQTYGGSPIITSSIRKRHHSGSDRDRTKRTPKPLHQLFENQSEPVSSQLGCNTVEATPLESLPGHTNLRIPNQPEHTTTQDSDGVCCTSTKNDFVDCHPLGESRFISKQTCRQGMEQYNSRIYSDTDGRSERCSSVLVLGKEKRDEGHLDDEGNRNSLGKGKTMATSTDELTTYSSIEVQTTPYALSDSESIGLDDEPIENLSLLTKELLNRTELQERIAENINKAILPIEMPSKDESICESMGGELNTSIMAELNNAIKSIVAATETDPIFEHFLDEIIGPNNDTDTSPDEDPDIRVFSEPTNKSRIHEEPSNTVVVDMDLEEEAAVMSNKALGLNGTTEVPLKQRLRSSSRQQNNKLEDDGDKPKEVERTDSSLEDHNAAAIMSIINANIVSEKPVAADKGSVSGNDVARSALVIQSTASSQAVSNSSESQVADSTQVVENDHADGTNTGKSIAKQSLCTRSNPESKVDQHELITEQEMMAMPTLIVCSREEIRDSIHIDSLYSSGRALPCSEARFVPIAPKGSGRLEPMKPLYLRTVQVPVQIPKKIQPIISNTKAEMIKMKPLSPRKISGTNGKRNRKVTRKSKNLKPAVIPTSTVTDTESLSVTNKEPPSNTDLESITLYANDNSFGTMIETGNMPAINLDDSMTLTSTGLSPYLKFHDNKSFLQEPELPCEKPSDPAGMKKPDVGQKEDVPITLPLAENILITRKTPKSLLKSRSKNNRLSMSTPRRRSSHIRALDFNTPIKSSSSEHKSTGSKCLQFSSKSSKRARSVCRTSLFKSPPFSHSFDASEKVRTPVKDRQLYKVPIATRSPAPKLMGGWDKYTGVGMILGGTSPHPSSSSSVIRHDKPCSPVKTSSSTVKKSWDADLRQTLQEYQQPPGSTSVAQKGPAKVKGRASKNSSTDVEEMVSKSESSDRCDRIRLDKAIEQHEPNIIIDRMNKQEITEALNDTPGVSSEAQTNSPALTKSTNVELGVGKDAQIAQLPLQDEPVARDKVEISKSDTKTKEELVSEFGDSNEIKEKPVVKKYAKLKTLETKISRNKRGQMIENTASCSANSNQKKCEYFKISPESQSHPSRMSQLIDLKTPSKTHNPTGIPATPRLLSPSSSTITPFTKIAEELSKVPSFVSTPDFPPTPSIALTPKAMEDNTIDAIKKGDYGTCSPYYQPSTERPEVLEKLIDGSNNLKANASEVLPVTSSMNIETTSAVNESVGIASDFAMATSSSKLEITQFEVIKENLPKEDADKKLKISTNPKHDVETSLRLENPAPSEIQDSNEGENEVDRSSNHDDSSSSSGNESSDSSSSDTSSSSSCSSSCSCSSIATTSTPFKSVMKCKTKATEYRDISNDCGSKHMPITTMEQDLLNKISPIISRDTTVCTVSENSLIVTQTVSSIARAETSPVKLLPLIKTQEEVDASAEGTPAKDEALLSEANISETPSSSKSGIESLTNLNSKISAFDSPRDQSISRHIHSAKKIHAVPSTRPKSKIISVQHFLPDVSGALKPPPVSEMVSSTTQAFNSLSTLSSVALDGKLGSHLEEKRLRLMAKLKNKPQPKILTQKVKAKQTSLRNKNKYKDKHDMPKTSGYQQKVFAGQAASHNPTEKIARISEKTEINPRIAKIQTEHTSENPTDCKAKVIQSETSSAKFTSQERKYNKCSTTQGALKKLTNIDGRKGSTIGKKDDGVPSRSNRIIEVDAQSIIQKKEERRRSAEIFDGNIPSKRSGDLMMVALDPKECAITKPVDTTEMVKVPKDSSGTICPTHSTKDTSSVSQKRDPTCKRDPGEEVDTIQDKHAKVLSNCSEDTGYVEENVVVPIKKSQIVPLSKVDQIKRDLFSDEENSDQRTTRSRTRQLSDAQKNDPALAVSESVSQIETKAFQCAVKKPGEELASVLECLKLVPANKNEMVEITSPNPKSSINKFAEYEFVYDDTIPIKKKRLKFSSINLQYVINVELRDDNYRECPKLMTSTNYEEIFNISPKPKKRVVAKKLIKTSKPPRAEISKTTSAVGTILENELTKPLASASQSVKLRVPISKATKSTTKFQHKSLKPTDKDDEKCLKDADRVLNKRKMTDLEEDQSGEKKRRIADPQTLLKKLDLDLFLNSVHGPT